MKHISMEAGFVFSPQPMYMIGTKRTAENILREGRFSANMVTEDHQSGNSRAFTL